MKKKVYKSRHKYNKRTTKIRRYRKKEVSKTRKNRTIQKGGTNLHNLIKDPANVNTAIAVINKFPLLKYPQYGLPSSNDNKTKDRTALYLACELDDPNIELVTALLEAGYPLIPNGIHAGGHYPQHGAVQAAIRIFNSEKYTEVKEKALRKILVILQMLKRYDNHLMGRKNVYRKIAYDDFISYRKMKDLSSFNGVADSIQSELLPSDDD
jgi:hypothetical protein